MMCWEDFGVLVVFIHRNVFVWWPHTIIIDTIFSIWFWFEVVQICYFFVFCRSTDCARSVNNELLVPNTSDLCGIGWFGNALDLFEQCDQRWSVVDCMVLMSFFRLAYWMDHSMSYPIKMENFHKIQSSLEPRIPSANQYLTRLECACAPCICGIAHFKRCVETSYAWRDSYFYWHIFSLLVGAIRQNGFIFWEIMPTNRSIHSLFFFLCLHIKINFITYNFV